MVMPGVAFDRQGGRLGHGWGWYDRMAADLLRLGPFFRVGLAFDCQVVERVPRLETDIRVDAVVTETQVIRSAGRAP
jgi:5-formyltetrahydrofolate cyclo-ligase